MVSADFDPRLLDEEIDRRAVPALKVHPIVLGADGMELFPAGVADMDFKAPPVVLEAIQERLNHGIFGYETIPADLIPALTAWLGRRHGWTVNADHVLRAPNILNALAMAACRFTDPGDGVIVQSPVFFDFFDILSENQRTIVDNPLRLEDGRYVMDFEDLERKAAPAHVKMIYLCNPHNPVGRVWTRDELQTLGDICSRHGVLVVADEMHGDLAFPGTPYVPFASLGPAYAANAITCISPAKTFNIAANCSAFTIVSNEDLRRAFQAENSRLTVNKNNAFANAAMVAAYTQGEPWLNAVLAYLADNIALIRRRLTAVPAVRMIEPEGTFLVWMDFRGLGLGPDELTAFLRKEARWGVTRGHAFGEAGAGFARLNVGCTTRRLDAALDQLTDAITNRSVT